MVAILMLPLLFGLQQVTLPLGTPQIEDPRLVVIGSHTSADFDLDGVPDLAVANAFLQMTAGPFTVLYLDDQGGVRTVERGPLSPYSLALYQACCALDVNGDGLPDLVTANSAGAIEVFENGGPEQLRRAGTPFRAPWLLDSLAASMGISGVHSFTFPTFFSADLDRDGLPDLVACGQVERLFQGSQSIGLRVWFGDATGQLQARATASLGLAIAARARDFDHDGILELVTLGRDGCLTVFQVANRSLMQIHRSILPATWPPTAMDVSDLDGDGVADYAVAGDPGTGAVLVLTGTPGGATHQGFALTLPPASAPGEIPSVRILDLDSDGQADVLLLQSFGVTTPARLVWFRGRGAGAFDPPVTKDLPGIVGFRFPPGQPPSPAPDLLGSTDLTHDGNPDVVIGWLQPRSDRPPALAVLANSSPARCLVAHRGQGATGSGGFRPRIGVRGGPPVQDQPAFGITLTDAVGGGAWAVLLCGTTPIDLTVLGELSFYTLPRFASVHATLGSGPGGGHIVAPCPIPDDPNVNGAACWFQWVIADGGPGRMLPMTTSDAVQVVVGQRLR